MDEIRVEHDPAPAKLDVMGVYEWPIWTKEASTFAWTYDSKEVCYFLDGDVTVTPDRGAPVRLRAGDLVTFPQGMKCVWAIHEAVRKHYDFG